MGDDRQVARNFLALGGGEVFSRLILFAATLYLARVLGAESYGLMALAAGATLYLAKIADFAIETMGTYEVARAAVPLPRLVSAVLGARLALAGVLVLVTVSCAQAFLPYPARTILSLFSLTLIPVAASTRWVHLGHESARPVGITRVIGEAVGLAIILATVHDGADLWLVPIAQLLGECLVVTILYVLLIRGGLPLRLSWDPATALPVFRRALPLVAQLMLGLILYNSALGFLRVMRDNASVGFYSAAYTLISFLANLGIAYGISLLPTITRLGAGTQGERALYHTALAQIFAWSFPISVGGCLLADPIIALAFGPDYASAGALLQVLIWAIPLSMLRNVPRNALVARGHQGLVLRATVYAVAANLLANLLLIHLFGTMGAAVATVLTESLSGVLMLYYGARQGLAFVPLRRLSKSAVAGLIMGGTVAACAAQPMLLRAALGAGVYAAALGLLGGIRVRRGALPVLDV